MSDHCHHRVLRLRWEPQGTPPSRPEPAISCKTGREPLESTADGGRDAIGGDKPAEVARTLFATDNGEFELRAFEYPSGYVYVVLVKGQLGEGSSVLTRVHSECLTGDALGSRRCDCGLQLRNALRAIGREGRGVLVYATGHEGRGIGLVNKLRAYVLQENGYDTVDANHLLGFPADIRDYAEAARCLALVGVRSVRLLTNNPRKVEGLRRKRDRGRGGRLGCRPRPTRETLTYLRSKHGRLGHSAAIRGRAGDDRGGRRRVRALLGDVRESSWRPYVVLKYAQTLDGRIASRTGDSKWISGEEERRISHALRATSDAVLVGIGTVLTDDPQLTVRLVPGASPLRVILDSTLRVPSDARILEDDASTMVISTTQAQPASRLVLRNHGVAVHSVGAHPAGVDAAEALRLLRRPRRSLRPRRGRRPRSHVVPEGETRRSGDRRHRADHPRRGDGGGGRSRHRLGRDGLQITNQSVYRAGNDLLLAGDLQPATAPP